MVHAKVSVITPTHNPIHLREVWESLKAQTHTNFEWIVCPNNGAKVSSYEFSDHRIKVVEVPQGPQVPSIGFIKNFAFSLGDGEWLLELDHDDLLHPRALELVVSRTNADFVYSDCLEINVSDSSVRKFSFAYGWEYKDDGAAYAPELFPSNVSRIWFAPNHLRAWRREFYHSIGGHNPDLPVADDHDLICRSVISGRAQHIAETLYTYRVHGDNSWLKNVQQINTLMWQNHDKYIYDLALKWGEDRGLKGYDLGGGIDAFPGLISVDKRGADLNMDLDGPWEIDDRSASLVRAYDLVEHLKDPIHTMNEIHRITAHGGVVDIMVPSTDGVGAWCDPTHRSFWNERSFRYYTEPAIRRYIEPECAAKFQVIRLTKFNRWEDQVPYVRAELVALHDGPRIHGVSSW